ncbi:murein hydrolase activator EnvC family protein [Longitalea luteola]|uniref:murein hydrolase activator EnvC family protein n=1 Tax=Longitalea luteola TaxID=2812563 RepID=UPI001A97BC56|nr:peptidoglycan DD-metalloendopeptidase family protein [Longitalea luteola]
MPKLMISCFVALLMAIAVCAQTDSESLKQQQLELQREIEELKTTLSDSKKQSRASIRQLELVKEKLRLREKAIKNINRQVDILEGNIGRSKKDIDSLKNRLDTMKSQYARNIVYAYKLRNNYEFLSFIFSAPNFNDALRRVNYFRSYHKYCEEQVEAIKKTRQILSGKINGLEIARREKDAVMQKQEKQMEELEEEKREKNAVVKTLKSREKEITRELAAKKKADIKLRNEIQRFILREIRDEDNKANGTIAGTAGSKRPITKKATHSVLANTPEGIRISGSFEKNKGKLPWPVEKALVKLHFGPNRIPNGQVITYNPGITLETEKGASVKAIFEGDVTAVFPVEGTWTVMVRHGKYFTVYGSLATVNVSRNHKVSGGQVLGTAAANDDGYGELEFILMQERKNIDPAKWLIKK